MLEPDPRVSVVMITWNRKAEVLTSLCHLAALPEKPEIVLVDNGSSDGVAAAVANNFPHVRVIEAGANFGAAGRNLGVRQANTPYVAFCDDDTWWEPGSLSCAADLFDRHADLAVIMARVVVGREAIEDPICQSVANGPLPREAGMPGYPLVGFLGGASVMRRTAFLEAGGYRPELGIGGEEEWLAAELLARGWKMTFLPQLCVHHFPSAHRDGSERRWRVICNALCFAWLRRPWRSAVRRTISMAAASPWDRVTASAFASALLRIIRLRRERKIVPVEVENAYCLLDAWAENCRPTNETIEEAVDAIES